MVGWILDSSGSRTLLLARPRGDPVWFLGRADGEVVAVVRRTSRDLSRFSSLVQGEIRRVDKDRLARLPMFAEQGIETVLFTNGAAGDINPRVPVRNFEEMEKAGRAIGKAAWEAISDMAFSGDAKVDFQEQKTAFGHMDGSER